VLGEDRFYALVFRSRTTNKSDLPTKS
jgi:hypothetical protein